MDADVLPVVDVARQVLTAALVMLVVTVAGCTSGDDTTDTTTSSTVPATPTTVPVTSSTTSTTQPTTTFTTTTTTLPEPPHLEVLDPVHGATVTTARYTFTGATDPGCTVTVGGRYEATVEADGTWSLDLMLERGRNSTTFTATHPETGLETSTAIRVYHADLGGLVLQRDGLGIVSFGDPVDHVTAILTHLLGPPTSDEVHTDVLWGQFGSLHEVRWSSLGLYLQFVDWDVNFTPLDSPVFTYWTAGGPLRTPEGVGPGSLWADMAAIYGDDAKASREPCESAPSFFSFVVGDLHPAPGEMSRYFGYLTGDPADPTSSVAWMEAGREAFPQGC